LEFPLELAWRSTPKSPPRPAFADPLSRPSGIDFAYVRDHSEPVQLKFDHAYHPVAASGRVFFGSSADDAVRCVSLETGEQQWVFVTGGPVRFAPHVVGDRLFVASDDGFLYCLAADSGKLLWRFRAAPSGRQLVGNGRMISRWPLRTGVLAFEDTVYVTAGMWPAEGVFVYALDAQTGSVRWVNDTSGTLNQPTANRSAYAIAGVAPTGYLLADKGALIAPTGRSIPASFALNDGRLLSSTAPSYQNRRGGPAVCIDRHGSVIFGYPRERLTPSAYSVHYAYQLPNLTQFGTIRADRVLAADQTYVIVNDLIRCYSANSRYTKVKVTWQVDCPSKSVHCMAMAANALLLGVDNRVVARDPQTGEILWQVEGLDGFVLSLAIADGKLLVATDQGSVSCFATDGAGLVAQVDSPTVTADKPPADAIISDRALQSVVENQQLQRGMALVVGQTDTTLASQLSTTTQLQVVLLLEDAAAVMQARRALLDRAEPTQGQVSVQQFHPDQPLPFADYAFNLIAATDDFASDQAAELQRVLRPAGGLLYVQNADQSLTEKLAQLTPRAVAGSMVYRRGKLKGALDWDSETTTDQRVKWPLELLWFGEPGSKRTGSGSRAPVASGGRNLVIGKNHLTALDAYNGTPLWTRTLPYLYRNIGRLRGAPGPIQPWLTQSMNADDDHVYLNFGHVVFKLNAQTGEQQAVHGELPSASDFSLQEKPRFVLDHFQKPSTRGDSAVATKAKEPAGSIQLAASADGESLIVTLQLAPNIEITDKVYWELFFDMRPPMRRSGLYEDGVFHWLVRPAKNRVEEGVGSIHPQVSVTTPGRDDSRTKQLAIPFSELDELCPGSLDDFCFAAALNHPVDESQQKLSGGRSYLRWEVYADAFAYSFNNGWARITRRDDSPRTPRPLADLSELPPHALTAGRIGGVGRRNASVIGVGQERENPLSLETGRLQYQRGKGCGLPVFAGGLHVMRSGTLAFYDLEDDSGMRYFGGVRPSCTVSAVPAQGLVFAAEGSSGCSCNYNFKTTLALAPASRRRHEDWAMFTAPLSPGAMLRTGRFNLGAPGDRRDDQGDLWLQYPRAPAYTKHTLPVPVELFGETIKPYRVNADRVAIAGTDRPWLYASGFEGIEGLRLQLFMSDKEGVAVFPSEPPQLDAKLTENGWDARYAVVAGNGGAMMLSHDKDAIYLGVKVERPLDRRGIREAWKTKGSLPHAMRFTATDPAVDDLVWKEDSLEFLISDVSLQTILHFGVSVGGGRYDAAWSTTAKKEDPTFAGAWSGAVHVTADQAVAEFALPWKTLKDAGLDLKNLVIRPRAKAPLTRQPHITHGFRPVLLQGQPKSKRYQVRLHFAELGEVVAGERLFDIQLQGKTVAENFDSVAAAGGPRRALVKVFENVSADRALDIRFIRRGDPDKRPPAIAAVEVLLE